MQESQGAHETLRKCLVRGTSSLSFRVKKVWGVKSQGPAQIAWGPQKAWQPVEAPACARRGRGALCGEQGPQLASCLDVQTCHLQQTLCSHGPTAATAPCSTAGAQGAWLSGALCQFLLGEPGPRGRRTSEVSLPAPGVTVRSVGFPCKTWEVTL